MQWLVVRESAFTVLAGVGVGICGAAAAVGLVRTQLFGIEPVDPVTYALPALSMAMARPSSMPAPPMYPRYTRSVPSAVTFATKASSRPLSTRSGPTLAGNDGTFLPTLEMGEPGGVLVASHLVGAEMREIYDAVQAGDLDRAREIDAKLRPIYEMISHVNPIPVKAALDLLGICSSRARLPIVEASEEEREEIRQVLERHGLLAGSAA